MNTQSLAHLDALLFEPHKWFVIDRDQHKLADVLSLANGLAAIAHGDAAAVVGRLAPEVAVIDVDAGGVEGDAITQNLVTWLHARHTWHLVRPSGGGPGRHHVYCVPGPATSALTAFTQHLRTAYRLPAVKIDHRGAGGASPWLRPLSSPHRISGATPTPLASPTELATAFDRLSRLLRQPSRTQVAPPTKTARRTTARARKANAAAAEQTLALQPLPRRRRDLEPRWTAWLAGTSSAPTLRGGDQSRSAIELAATTALLRTGIGPDDAWRTVSTAAGPAFAKARSRGRTWWVRHQWNVAVRSDTNWTTTTATTSRAASPTTSPEVAHAVTAARTDLTGLQWFWGPRQRHSILLVAHTLLDRMHREDTLAVPCPLRNIEEDTGLARNTVLAALALLDGHLGRRLRTFDPTRAEASSHEFELAPQYSQTSLSLPEPPRVTPTHRHPPGRWASLSPTAHSVWRTLNSADQAGVTVEEVAAASGLTHTPNSSPTARQARTTTAALDELAELELAIQSRPGAWTVSHAGNRASMDLAAGAYHRHHVRIAAEREHYRSGAWNRWNRDKLRILRAARARQSHWWSSLTELERQERTSQSRLRHRRLTQDEQAAERLVLALRRHRAGEPSERYRHAAWCRTFTREVQANRSAEWQAWFATLPPHQRAARKRLLDQYRRDWNLPATWSSSTSIALVDNAA